MINNKHTVTLFASILLVPIPAFAHLGIGADHGFGEGFIHPLLGPDHLLVMIAVGLWAFCLGGWARWLLPLSFLSAMAFGAGLAFAGISVSYPEFWVVLSVLVSGIIVLRDWHLSLTQACIVAAMFALSHGYVHALEIGPDADRTGYALGFLLSTASLHGIGLAAGSLSPTVLKWTRTAVAVSCAMVGLTLLLGA
ncbi:MAG: HupE/UreJ family protein [Methylomicrobium sp.]|nr:HupE/UreJ family protein [Methylomicrobium sp.]